jgi:hypothetical protein
MPKMLGLVRAGVTDSTVVSVLRLVETRVAAKGIELYSFASSDTIKTTRPLLDLLRGPAPYAFARGHCGVGYFQNCVAKSRSNHDFLSETLISETNHREFDGFGRGSELFEAK